MTGWRHAAAVEWTGSLLALGNLVVAGLVVVAAIVVSPIELLYLPIVLGLLVVSTRLARMRVDVDQDGLVIINPLRSVKIAWAELAGLTVARWKGWRCRALAMRWSGPPVPISVFMVSPMYYDTRVEEAVSELRSLGRDKVEW